MKNDVVQVYKKLEGIAHIEEDEVPGWNKIRVYQKLTNIESRK